MSLRDHVIEHKSRGALAAGTGFVKMPKGYALMVTDSGRSYYWLRWDGVAGDKMERWPAYQSAKLDAKEAREDEEYKAIYEANRGKVRKPKSARKTKKVDPMKLTKTHKTILRYLQKWKEVDRDALAGALGFSVDEVASCALVLSRHGLIERDKMDKFDMSYHITVKGESTLFYEAWEGDSCEECCFFDAKVNIPDEGGKRAPCMTGIPLNFAKEKSKKIIEAQRQTGRMCRRHRDSPFVYDEEDLG